MTYRITIESKDWTLHVDGFNKAKLKAKAKRLLKEYNVAGRISEVRVVTPEKETINNSAFEAQSQEKE